MAVCLFLWWLVLFLVVHVCALVFLVFARGFRVFRGVRVFPLLVGPRKNQVAMVVCVVGGCIGGGVTGKAGWVGWLALL